MIPDADPTRALADAHRQLLERDQRIDELEQENAALREHLTDILASKAWRTAEALRSMRSRILRRAR